MEAQIDNRKLHGSEFVATAKELRSDKFASADFPQQTKAVCRSSQASLTTMFAQGQLLGMQTDLLNRLKVEVNAWEKVAEKHPCAAQF